MSESTTTEIAAHLLKIIAIGLIKEEENGQSRRPQPITLLNQHLRHGWEELCYRFFREGVLPPRTLPAFIKLLHQPVSDWPVLGELYAQLGDHEPLLFNGSATPLCFKLAEPLLHTYNPRLELEDENFRRLYDLCARRGDDQQYTKVRTFINRQPTLPDPFKSISGNTEWDTEIRKGLIACYENIPLACIKRRNGKPYLVLCPHCGWALQWQGEEATCHTDGVCQAACGDLSQSEQWIPYSNGMARTKEGIQRYVVAPEVTLMSIYDTLVKEWGLTCQLYPSLDAYDLLVKFPNGKAWAADVKDHRIAVRLAVNLTYFRAYPHWDQAFYVFPNYHADTAYLNEFGNFWLRENNVSYCGASDFLGKVRRELNR